ncbi:hypothetical protein TUBRATIS_30940 [Tubulinosema ratisbonensis]|uniref:Uncharacterized protein n=1 Tax=Tubulinosema ratisbonensis TaxID=291195 RepID=A0A437AH46_9MICR|nr:hypothetical protein TUBRATIS_30940 [Tubulinosema ratisbonensis]
MIVSNFIKEQPIFYQQNQSTSLNQRLPACSELTKSHVENAVEQKEETIKPKQTQAHSAEHKTKDKLKPTYRIFVSTTPRTGNGSKKARQPVTDLDKLSVSELKEKITELKSELRFDAKFKFNGTQSYLANKTRRYIRYRRNNQNKWLSNLEITEICGAINKSLEL